MSEVSILNKDPTLTRKFNGHKKGIRSLSFHPNSNQLASSSDDHSVMIWNLAKDMKCYRYSGHTDVVSDVEFSVDGNILASTSFDRDVRFWETTVKGTSSSFCAHTAAVRCLTFSPDNTKVCVNNKVSFNEATMLSLVIHRFK